MDGLKSIAELRAASQETLIEFLRTDLAICATLTDVVITELSLDRQGAQQAFNRAERAYEVVEYFAERVEDMARRQEIEQKLTLLRSRLNDLKDDVV